ncbi:chitinase-like protein Idgf2 [Drosophila nasuta]|uniref:chitinase-like protein Idgf2 n=1 Tax=Drosophila nasuta TaxID=42062 RepID=UPI00295EBBC0|nr:chitinase-like protein Idgf2 [Drosophila nasuta]
MLKSCELRIFPSTMKLLALILLLPCLYAEDEFYRDRNLVCFYNSDGVKLPIKDLALAVQFCTHLIYGYAGIRSDNYEAHSLNEELDIKNNHFTEVTSLKSKYPKLKVLLSVGGDRDIDEKHPNKYIELLEAGSESQKGFAKSALSLVKTYGFDGLDLAYQFPKNKPKEVQSTLGAALESVKKFFTGDSVVDSNAEKHKEQFISIAREVKDVLHPNGFLLSLTVLPNVNSTWYFDIPKLNGLVDFVNLATFDFLTPERNPEEADYTASLIGLTSQERLSHLNVLFQTDYWMNEFPVTKINLGIPAYGNAWKLTEESGNTGKPIIHHTNGPAPAGPYTKKAGLLSYTEICTMLANVEDEIEKDVQSPIEAVNFGNYAYRPAKGSGHEGIWISYDDLDTIRHKAMHADPLLGGVALFNLEYDDFGGVCSDKKFPVLRTIRKELGLPLKWQD